MLIKSIKSVNPISIVLLICGLTACGGGTTASSSSSLSPNIDISELTRSSIAIGESLAVTVSIPSANLSTAVTTVLITNNNPETIDITPTSCNLTESVNSCQITSTGTSVGSGTFSASALGFNNATSQALTVNLSGVVFGNAAGLMFENNTLLPGTAKMTSVDANQINGIVINASNTMYAGGNSGKVYQYLPESGYWINLPGNGAGGTLDGGAILVLALNQDKMYAATSNGGLFVYIDKTWNSVGTGIGSSIQSLIFDQQNNIYVGGENGNIYKYVNNRWRQLGVDIPDTTTVNGLAITSDGTLYAATSGNNTDGQVYSYADESWTAISSFTAGAVNTLTSESNTLYASTSDGVVHKFVANTWTDTESLDGTALAVLTVNDGNLYAATTGNGNFNGQVYTYNTNTTSWDQVSSLNNGTIFSLTVHNNKFYVGTANNNYPSIATLYTYTTGDVSWSAIGGSNTLDGTPIYSVTIDESGAYYAGTNYNVFKYLKDVKSWIQLGNLYILDSSGASALATYHTITYAATFAGQVFYNNSDSSNWVLLGSQIQNSSITSLAVDSDGSLYASTNLSSGDQNYGQVLHYNIVTQQWDILPGTGSQGSLDNSVVLSITIDESHNIYAGTGVNHGQVWEYPESGTSWHLVGTGTLDGSEVFSVTTDNLGNVYAGTQFGNVFKYNGTIWQQLGTSPLDGSLINRLTFNSAGILYAVTQGGNVWYYSPNQNTWYNMFYGTGVGVFPSVGAGF